jgi:hypothetical protein
MTVKKHFTQQVAKAIFDFTKANPRNAKAELAESVWGFGFTKDSPRKIFSLSKMFLSCQHVTTGQNVYFGFTIEPGDEPLQFIVKHWTQTGDETVTRLGTTTEQVAKVEDVPAIVHNAVNKAKELANALRLEQGRAR